MIHAFAPAKVNLCLHVTGKRADGYHLLDSLVIFADCGDWLQLNHGPMALRIDGPEGGDLTGDNLVTQAAQFMGRTATITLTKNLPIASGIGGGSADAAACLRGLAALHDVNLPNGTEALGADLPMCLAAYPLRATGIGQNLQPLPDLPAMWMVLANPRVPVSTPEVFSMLQRTDTPPVAPLPPVTTAADFAAYLQSQRNDLEAPACKLCPAINDVLTALNATAPLLARMSGSGATCFGLYPDAAQAKSAAVSLRQHHPRWWVQDAAVLGPKPQLIRATT